MFDKYISLNTSARDYWLMKNNREFRPELEHVPSSSYRFDMIKHNEIPSPVQEEKKQSNGLFRFISSLFSRKH